MNFSTSSVHQTKCSSTKLITEDLEVLSLNKLNDNKSESYVPRLNKKRPLLSLKITKTIAKSSEYTYNINDDYEILDNLGMGTYAYVRKARCRSSNQIVAIKVSRGTTSSAMLKSEYDILKQVSHRCIPRVFKFEENVSKHESYIIMEYFEGVTLDTRIADNGVMNEDESKAVVSQLLSVVQYLHSVGVAHRDIKPENVLINDNNEIKLIDFNISKHFDRNAADDKFKCVFYTQISSPFYSAPELKTRLGYNESVDIWGVGTVLFTLLFGTFTSHLLNKEKNVLDCSSCIRDIINEDTKISDECKCFMLSMLEDESNNRPTADEAITLGWI